MNVFKNLFTLVFSLSFAFLAHSQDYPKFSATDSIAGIIFDDYQKGEQLLETLENNHRIDPSMEIIFAFESLRNNDLNNFKKRIKKLIRQHGCSWFTSVAFQKRDRVIPMLELAESKKVDKWLMTNSDRWIRKWMKNNMLSIEIRIEVEKLVVRDQQLIKDFTPLINSDTISDEIKSFCLAKMQSEGKSIISEVKELCQLNGGIFPNSFDNCVGLDGKLGLFIGHNSEISPENFTYTWSLLSTFIEKAVLEGKISKDLLLMHDQYSYKWFGYQKYGYLGDEIPKK